MPVTIKQLKPFGILLIAVTLIISSCKKNSTPAPEQCCAAGTAPTLFEVVDDNGEGMILSLKDSVVISYADSDKTKSFKEPVAALDPALVSTADYKTFNGFVIEDMYGMAALNTRPKSPVYNFNLRINGHDLGLLYFNYESYKNTQSQSTTTSFTLTELPARNIETLDKKHFISVLQAK